MLAVLGTCELNVAGEHQIDDASTTVGALHRLVDLDLDVPGGNVLLEYLCERLVIHRQVILLAEYPSVFSDNTVKLGALTDGVLELGVEY
ncbi:MAG: hypothetical protein WA624_06605 [Methylocella sp.]